MARFLSVLCVGTAALLGWPFAALLGIPTVGKEMYRQTEFHSVFCF